MAREWFQAEEVIGQDYCEGYDPDREPNDQAQEEN